MVDTAGSVVSFDVAAGAPADTETALREALADAYHLFARWGWTELLFNHITMRIPGPETHFLINPFGLLFEEVTPANLVKIDVDGRAVEPTDWPVNPAGFTIHAAVHAARPDAHCVMHTHTVAGMAVAQLVEGILPRNFQAMQLHGRVGYHDFEGITVDLDEQSRLVESLGDNKVLVLRNHGLLSVGRTIGEALFWMFTAQKACEIQLAATGTGRPEIQPPPDVIAKVSAQTAALAASSPQLFETIFAAYRRQLRTAGQRRSVIGELA